MGSRCGAPQPAACLAGMQPPAGPPRHSACLLGLLNVHGLAGRASGRPAGSLGLAPAAPMLTTCALPASRPAPQQECSSP